MGNQQFCLKPLAAGLILSGILALAGCSSGSSSSPPAAADAPPTVSGVAATGVAMAGATVTLTDATGKTLAPTTTLADGSYSFDVTGLTAPFVIKVSGTVNDTAVTLMSVQDTAPTSGTVTVNVTPITNAIAAALSSTGNPLDLDAKADAATIKSKIADIKSFITQSLAPTLTASGVDATKFDPMNTVFTANRTGFDKALDNISIDVAPDGTISMSNKTAVGKVDDAAESSTAPAASLTANGSTVISFSKADDFKAKAAAAATAPKLEASAEDSSVADKAVAAFNACFKLASAQRPTDPACTGLVSSTYKNNGMSATQELGGFLSSSGMDNAAFNKPEVIRYLYSDATKPADRVVVRISWIQTDGTGGNISTVAKNFGADGWKLDGNQRNYFLYANAAINRVEQTSLIAVRVPSHYDSGINFFVSSSKGNAATINWVKVTGNGLPAAGLILKPLAGCAYLAISSKSGSTTQASGACGSIYKLTGIALDGSTGADKLFAESADFTSTTGNTYTSFAFGKVDPSTIKPFDAYTFQIRDTSGGDTYIVERLRSRPMNLAELASAGMSRKWAALDAATKASLDPTNAGKFVGGAQFPVTWVRADGAPPVYGLNVQFRTGNNTTPLINVNPPVPLTATSFKVSAPAGVTFPAATSTALGYQFVQLVARNPNDLQVFATTRYDNF